MSGRVLPAQSPRPAEAWLAMPEAAARFDPSQLTGAERDAWAAIRTARRRHDWESSRALLSAVPAAVDERHSLSHSHGFAALAVAPGSASVGVDLEWLAPRNFTGMASVAYSAAESAHLSSLDDPAEVRSTFYELWTLKEAFAKALQLHLADALRLCSFVDSSGQRRATVPTTLHWRATVHAPRPQLRLAVVRMYDSPVPLRAAMNTMEWPLPRTGEWPVVLDLEGGGHEGGVC